jgi:hypothetical protein
MLSHVVFKRKEEYSADVVEKPKRHKDKSHKRHKKEESKRKVKFCGDMLHLMRCMRVRLDHCSGALRRGVHVG